MSLLFLRGHGHLRGRLCGRVVMAVQTHSFCILYIKDVVKWFSTTVGGVLEIRYNK